ncbi:unnamed protein product [Amoebophrya sp. A120]|nr:unnamed protein product [Amoebophrya sp. A120]|eukprot:GSA120T00018528001.1
MPRPAAAAGVTASSGAGAASSSSGHGTASSHPGKGGPVGGIGSWFPKKWTIRARTGSRENNSEEGSLGDKHDERSKAARKAANGIPGLGHANAMGLVEESVEADWAEYDRDGDGELSRTELMEALKDNKLCLSRGLLLERLQLEIELYKVMVKILNFFVYFICFLLALYQFYPTDSVGKVHSYLLDHFELDPDSLGEVATIPDLYSFILNFEQQNKLLQATGPVYWCDPRYLDDLGKTAAGEIFFASKKGSDNPRARRKRNLDVGADVAGEDGPEGQNSLFAGEGGEDNFSSSAEDDGSSNNPFYEDRKKSSVSPEEEEQLRDLRRKLEGGDITGDDLASVLEKMTALRLRYQNPSPMGYDLHNHVFNLYDCQNKQESPITWFQSFSYPGGLVDTMRKHGSDPADTDNYEVEWTPTYYKDVPTMDEDRRKRALKMRDHVDGADDHVAGNENYDHHDHDFDESNSFQQDLSELDEEDAEPLLHTPGSKGQTHHARRKLAEKKRMTRERFPMQEPRRLYRTYAQDVMHHNELYSLRRFLARNGFKREVAAKIGTSLEELETMPVEQLERKVSSLRSLSRHDRRRLADALSTHREQTHTKLQTYFTGTVYSAAERLWGLAFSTGKVFEDDIAQPIRELYPGKNPVSADKPYDIAALQPDTEDAIERTIRQADERIHKRDAEQGIMLENQEMDVKPDGTVRSTREQGRKMGEENNQDSTTSSKNEGRATSSPSNSHAAEEDANPKVSIKATPKFEIVERKQEDTRTLAAISENYRLFAEERADTLYDPFLDAKVEQDADEMDEFVDDDGNAFGEAPSSPNMLFADSSNTAASSSELEQAGASPRSLAATFTIPTFAAPAACSGGCTYAARTYHMYFTVTVPTTVTSLAGNAALANACKSALKHVLGMVDADFSSFGAVSVPTTSYRRLAEDGVEVEDLDAAETNGYNIPGGNLGLPPPMTVPPGGKRGPRALEEYDADKPAIAIAPGNLGLPPPMTVPPSKINTDGSSSSNSRRDLATASTHTLSLEYVFSVTGLKVRKVNTAIVTSGFGAAVATKATTDWNTASSTVTAVTRVAGEALENYMVLMSFAGTEAYDSFTAEFLAANATFVSSMKTALTNALGLTGSDVYVNNIRKAPVRTSAAHRLRRRLGEQQDVDTTASSREEAKELDDLDLPEDGSRTPSYGKVPHFYPDFDPHAYLSQRVEAAPELEVLRRHEAEQDTMRRLSDDELTQFDETGSLVEGSMLNNRLLVSGTDQNTDPVDVDAVRRQLGASSSSTGTTYSTLTLEVDFQVDGLTSTRYSEKLRRKPDYILPVLKTNLNTQFNSTFPTEYASHMSVKNIYAFTHDKALSMRLHLYAPCGDTAYTLSHNSTFLGWLDAAMVAEFGIDVVNKGDYFLITSITDSSLAATLSGGSASSAHLRQRRLLREAEEEQRKLAPSGSTTNTSAANFGHAMPYPDGFCPGAITVSGSSGAHRRMLAPSSSSVTYAVPANSHMVSMDITFVVGASLSEVVKQTMKSDVFDATMVAKMNTKLPTTYFLATMAGSRIDRDFTLYFKLNAPDNTTATVLDGPSHVFRHTVLPKALFAALGGASKDNIFIKSVYDKPVATTTTNGDAYRRVLLQNGADESSLGMELPDEDEVARREERTQEALRRLAASTSSSATTSTTADLTQGVNLTLGVDFQVLGIQVAQSLDSIGLPASFMTNFQNGMVSALATAYNNTGQSWNFMSVESVPAMTAKPVVSFQFIGPRGTKATQIPAEVQKAIEKAVYKVGVQQGATGSLAVTTDLKLAHVNRAASVEMKCRCKENWNYVVPSWGYNCTNMKGCTAGEPGMGCAEPPNTPYVEHTYRWCVQDKNWCENDASAYGSANTYFCPIDPRYENLSWRTKYPSLDFLTTEYLDLDVDFVVKSSQTFGMMERFQAIMSEDKMYLLTNEVNTQLKTTPYNNTYNCTETVYRSYGSYSFLTKFDSLPTGTTLAAMEANRNVRQALLNGIEKTLHIPADDLGIGDIRAPLASVAHATGGHRRLQEMVRDMERSNNGLPVYGLEELLEEEAAEMRELAVSSGTTTSSSNATTATATYMQLDVLVPYYFATDINHYLERSKMRYTLTHDLNEGLGHSYHISEVASFTENLLRTYFVDIDTLRVPSSILTAPDLKKNVGMKKAITNAFYKATNIVTKSAIHLLKIDTYTPAAAGSTGGGHRRGLAPSSTTAASTTATTSVTLAPAVPSPYAGTTPKQKQTVSGLVNVDSGSEYFNLEGELKLYPAGTTRDLHNVRLTIEVLPADSLPVEIIRLSTDAAVKAKFATDFQKELNNEFATHPLTLGSVYYIRTMPTGMALSAQVDHDFLVKLGMVFPAGHDVKELEIQSQFTQTMNYASLDAFKRALASGLDMTTPGRLSLYHSSDVTTYTGTSSGCKTKARARRALQEGGNPFVVENYAEDEHDETSPRRASSALGPIEREFAEQRKQNPEVKPFAKLRPKFLDENGALKDEQIRPEVVDSNENDIIRRNLAGSTVYLDDNKIELDFSIKDVEYDRVIAALNTLNHDFTNVEYAFQSYIDQEPTLSYWGSSIHNILMLEEKFIELQPAPDDMYVATVFSLSVPKSQGLTPAHVEAEPGFMEALKTGICKALHIPTSDYKLYALYEYAGTIHESSYVGTSTSSNSTNSSSRRELASLATLRGGPADIYYQITFQVKSNGIAGDASNSVRVVENDMACDPLLKEHIQEEIEKELKKTQGAFKVKYVNKFYVDTSYEMKFYMQVPPSVTGLGLNYNAAFYEMYECGMEAAVEKETGVHAVMIPLHFSEQADANGNGGSTRQLAATAAASTTAEEANVAAGGEAVYQATRIKWEPRSPKVIHVVATFSVIAPYVGAVNDFFRLADPTALKRDQLARMAHVATETNACIQAKYVNTLAGYTMTVVDYLQPKLDVELLMILNMEVATGLQLSDLNNSGEFRKVLQKTLATVFDDGTANPLTQWDIQVRSMQAPVANGNRRLVMVDAAEVELPPAPAASSQEQDSAASLDQHDRKLAAAGATASGSSSSSGMTKLDAAIVFRLVAGSGAADMAMGIPTFDATLFSTMYADIEYNDEIRKIYELKSIEKADVLRNVEAKVRVAFRYNHATVKPYQMITDANFKTAFTKAMSNAIAAEDKNGQLEDISDKILVSIVDIARKSRYPSELKSDLPPPKSGARQLLFDEDNIARSTDAVVQGGVRKAKKRDERKESWMTRYLGQIAASGSGGSATESKEEEETRLQIAWDEMRFQMDWNDEDNPYGTLLQHPGADVDPFSDEVQSQVLKATRERNSNSDQHQRPRRRKTITHGRTTSSTRSSRPSFSGRELAVAPTGGAPATVNDYGGDASQHTTKAATYLARATLPDGTVEWDITYFVNKRFYLQVVGALTKSNFTNIFENEFKAQIAAIPALAAKLPPEYIKVTKSSRRYAFNTTYLPVKPETGRGAWQWDAPLDAYKVYIKNKAAWHHPEMPLMGQYYQRNKFPYRQVALLDTLVYQTRATLEECPHEAYSYRYVTQYANRRASIYGINAPKATDIFNCVTDEMQDLAYDPSIDTEGFSYLGNTVYARFVGMEGDHTAGDIDEWWRIGWLDLQTTKVVVSTMVYTQQEEIYTSVSAQFEVDPSGKVEGLSRFKSYVDLEGTGRAGTFMALAIITILSVLIGTAHSLYLVACGNRPTMGVIFEFVSRIILLVFSIWLFVGWNGLADFVEKYDNLLGTFLRLKDFDHLGLVVAIARFFIVKEKIHNEVSMIEQYRIMGFFVVFIQFLQLVSYMNVHPRVAVLTSTLSKSVDNMCHFFLVFLILYVVLAYLGHWIFGALAPDEFGTFGEAMSSQFKMIIGEFPFDSSGYMNTLEQNMFLLYLFMYAIIVFFTLMNFFLAIVVDAFIEVKAEIENQVTERSFPFDCGDMIKDVYCRAFRPGYADIHSLAKLLEEEEERDAPVAALYEQERKSADAPFHYPVNMAEVIELTSIYQYPNGPLTEENAMDFLARYGVKIPDMVKKFHRCEPMKVLCVHGRELMNAHGATGPQDLNAECKQALLDEVIHFTDKRRKLREKFETLSSTSDRGNQDRKLRTMRSALMQDVLDRTRTSMGGSSPDKNIDPTLIDPATGEKLSVEQVNLQIRNSNSKTGTPGKFLSKDHSYSQDTLSRIDEQGRIEQRQPSKLDSNMDFFDQNGSGSEDEAAKKALPEGEAEEDPEAMMIANKPSRVLGKPGAKAKTPVSVEKKFMGLEDEASSDEEGWGELKELKKK